PLDPGFNREVLELQVGRAADGAAIAAAVEYERLPHLTRTKDRIAHQRPVVAADLIQGVAFRPPPAHQTGRRREAVCGGRGWTFARAASVVDGLDCVGPQFPAVKRHLVNQSLEQCEYRGHR